MTDSESQQRILKSRQVLYDPNHSSDEYVGTYQAFWADHYDQDGEQLGFMAWDHAANAIERYVPNKEATILDFCGGTGQVGKRLHAKGYRNLHISDGSTNMLKQALELNVYKQTFTATVSQTAPAEFLMDSENKYDCVLSSMSLSEFQPFVEHIVTKVLKPGGIFISLEAIPHIAKCNLTGIVWLQREFQMAKNKLDLPFEILLDDDSVPHDRFTEDKMKLMVVKRRY
jgi:predicted TPR repeat methyltransferase